jgi:tRNA(fMet)-specific endonuclease VapC
MPYLLDTNVVIAILEDTSAATARRAKQERIEDLGISAIVAHELFYGAFRSRREDDNLSRFDVLRFPIIEFDRDDARQAGVIRAGLVSRGVPIGPYDVLIAGQAVARNLILVGDPQQLAQVLQACKSRTGKPEVVAEPMAPV